MGTTFELKPGRRASVDDQLVHTYTRAWTCYDNTGLDEHGIGVALGIPIGSRHPSFPAAQARSISVTENADNGAPGSGYAIWDVEVTYTNRFDVPTPQQAGTPPEERVEEPTLRAPDITVTGDMRQVPCVVDIDKKSFTNTLGDPMLPTPMRTVPTIKISVGRNYLVFPSGLFEMIGKVNNARVTIPRLNWSIQARALKLVNATANPQYENGIFYWAAKYTIELGQNLNIYTGEYLGWDVDIANMGKREVFYDGNNLKKIRLITEDLNPSQPVSEPRFLTYGGERIKSIDADGNTITGWESKIWWIRRRPDPEFNMALLWS